MLNFMVASCWLSSGDVKSSVSCYFYTRAHTLKKKNYSPIFRVDVANRRSIHMVLELGSTRDLGFATTFC
jgi:hypothetical protein